MNVRRKTKYIHEGEYVTAGRYGEVFRMEHVDA